MTSPGPAVGPRTWGPRSGLSVVAGVVALLAVGWLLLATSPTDRFFAGVLSLLAVAAAAAVLLLRHRLVAGVDGLRVATLTGVRTITWSQVTRISIVTRKHLGIGAATLHVDLGEDGLFIFGRLDLDADPEDVAAELNALKPQW